MPSGEGEVHKRSAGLDWQVWPAILLAVGLIAPLVVVPGIFFPYVVPRNILFRVAVELATAALVLRILHGASVNVRREPILQALVAFLFALVVSAVFSPARNHSLFGDFERMGGVWAWLHLTLFLVVLRSLDDRYLHRLLQAALAISLVASAHAIAGHFFSFGSGLTVVGNPGLLAGYLLLALAVALWLACTHARHRWLYLAAGAIDLAAMVWAANRSSVLGLATGAVAGSVLFALGSRSGRRRWIPVGLVAGSIACVVGLVAIDNAVRDVGSTIALPTSLRRIAATDFAGVDAIRTIQWDAAIAGFRDRPVPGYGPDNYHLVWSAHFDPLSEKLGADIFDRTHNQFLEILATTGIIGAISFLAVWLAIGYSLYRSFVEKRLTAAQMSVLAGANIAYAVYLVFWFVDINAAILWLLLGAVAASRRNPLPVVRAPLQPASNPLALAGMLVTALTLALALYTQAYIPLGANIALATLDSPQGDRKLGFEAVRTLGTSRASQTSHTPLVLGQFVNVLAATQQRGAVDWADREGVHQTFQTAIAAFDAELARDPLNDRLHAHAAELMIEAHSFYGARSYLERAITLATRGVELSPRRTKNRRVLDRVLAENDK